MRRYLTPQLSDAAQREKERMGVKKKTSRFSTGLYWILSPLPNAGTRISGCS